MKISKTIFLLFITFFIVTQSCKKNDSTKVNEEVNPTNIKSLSVHDPIAIDNNGFYSYTKDSETLKLLFIDEFSGYQKLYASGNLTIDSVFIEFSPEDIENKVIYFAARGTKMIDGESVKFVSATPMYKQGEFFYLQSLFKGMTDEPGTQHSCVGHNCTSCSFKYEDGVIVGCNKCKNADCQVLLQCWCNHTITTSACDPQ